MASGFGAMRLAMVLPLWLYVCRASVCKVHASWGLRSLAMLDGLATPEWAASARGVTALSMGEVGKFRPASSSPAAFAFAG